MIRALVKFVLFVGVVGFIGLVGFAYLGDLSPQTAQKTITVLLDGK